MRRNNNNNNNNQNNNTNNNNNNLQRRQNKNNPDNANFVGRISDTYCWTHRGCNHKSTECDLRAPRHKPQATFENKMGGFKAFCPPERQTEQEVELANEVNLVKKYTFY